MIWWLYVKGPLRDRASALPTSLADFVRDILYKTLLFRHKYLKLKSFKSKLGRSSAPAGIAVNPIRLSYVDKHSFDDDEGSELAYGTARKIHVNFLFTNASCAAKEDILM